MENNDTSDNPLLAEVLLHIEATGIKKTAFGEKAVGDPRFVFDLENGREPRNRTVKRVRDYMRANPTATAQAAE